MQKRILHNIFSCLLVLFVGTLHAQNVKLDQHVLGAHGDYDSSSTLIISSTVGEVVVSTLEPTTTAVILTQGFQQSFIADTMSFVLNSFGVSCVGRSDGFASIDSIKGCNAPYNVLWSNGSTGTTVNNLAAGNYTVQITSNNGCSKQIAFTISYIVNSPCLLKFYSGITPNNDGLNDKWVIDNVSEYEKNEVNIYNRLGNRVWEGKKYDNVNVVWGGENLSGNELPSDTYFYVFEEGGQVEKGWIELTR